MTRAAHPRAMPPIAIIGMQGRFPGGAGYVSEFFDQLLEGRVFSGPTPPDRWSARRFETQDRAAGKAPVSGGAFLQQDITTIDPDAFGMARDELAALDPQQRLVLEVGWEAIEHARIDPLSLAGAPVGVYVGGFTSDHLLNQFSSQARSGLSRHAASGATLTMLSNRLSHVLDLRGPSLTVDTACASSLTALALAAADLTSGACDLALVGGVNIMLRPEYPIGMGAAHLLAPDGRSKPFSARADGYGRGEGCGMLVLCPLDQAQAEGHPMLAVLDAIGTAHAGRTAGISLPNGAAQAELMSRVLARSGRRAQDIACVETHGTGTAQGDPIEARAIAEVYGQIPRDGPLPLGALKANIGHLEAAAGVAGLIKAVAMLQNGTVPPLPLDGAPNPAIPFAALNLDLPAAPRPLGSGAIAVNAFGYGGAMAHAILSPAPPPTPKPAAPEPAAPSSAPLMLLLSAHSRDALTSWTTRLAEHVLTAKTAPQDLAASLWHRKSRGPLRAALWVKPDASPQDLAKCLRQPFEPVRAGQTSRILFVYSGMGPQFSGMGKALFGLPGFQTAVSDFSRHLPVDTVEDVLCGRTPDPLPCRLAQPAHTALQIGLTAALETLGLRPDLVLGHSAGEMAAALASGHLDPATTAQIAHTRATLQDRCAGQGGMLAARMSADAAQTLCNTIPKLDLAAINSASDVTFAGPHDALNTAVTHLRQRHIPHRVLDGDIPYHSAAMDPLLAPLGDALSNATTLPMGVPLLSSVTGGELSENGMDAAYWQRNLRAPVCFADALQTASDLGVTHVIEIGARPVLQGALRRCLGREVHLCAISASDDDPAGALRETLSALWTSGFQVAPRTQGNRRLSLPPTIWQRATFWNESPVQAEDRLAKSPSRPLAEPGPTPRTWLGDLNRAGLRYLLDHRIEGTPTLPGATSIEAALEATLAASEASEFPLSLSDIRLEAPLTLDRSQGQMLDTRCVGGMVETLAYNPTDPATTQRLISATVAAPAPPPPPVPPHESAARAPFPLEINDHQTRLKALGMAHGPAFCPLRRLSLSGDGRNALAELAAPDIEDGYLLPPPLLDGVFQAALALLPEAQTQVPVALQSLTILAPFPKRVWAWIERKDSGEINASLRDEEGVTLAEFRGLTTRPLRPQTPDKLPDLCLITEWHALPGNEPPTEPDILTPDAQASLEDILHSICTQTAHKQNSTVIADATPPVRSAIQALCRTLHAEHETGVTCLAAPAHLADQLPPNQPEIRCRNGRFEAPRVVPVSLPPAPPILSPASTSLITGGLGGFGRQLALWLARHGAAHIVVTTRTPPAEAAIIPLRRALTSMDCRLTIAPLDLSDRTQLTKLVQIINTANAPLRAVFHWAGCTRDAPANTLTQKDFHDVLAPKVTAAQTLHDATKSLPLDHFVMASSITAMVGNPRQAAYAAANGWLDGLAEARHAEGLPALSAAFGAISGAGMAADPLTAAHLRAAGLRSMTPETALAGLGAAMTSGLPHVGLSAAIDLPRWRRYDPRSAATPRMSHLMAPLDNAPTDSASNLPHNLAALPPDARAARITANLRGIVATILGWSEDRIAPDVPLARQGLDSLGAVEVQLAIERDFGATLPIVLLLGGATPNTLARRIAQGMSP